MSHGIITRLRDFVPIRLLTREEALRIAEHQALRFLELADVTFPPVPESVITELPRLRVERLSPIPVSGSTHWVWPHWVIVLNGAEPITRQRFSLAHELKHVLDDRFIHVLYNGVDERDRAAWIEQVCDYFAGCLLIPRPWLKRAYTSGVQRLPDLATRFGVSQAAMQVRLNQIGLVDPAPRHDSGWALRAARAAGSSSHTYQRSARARALIT